MSLSTMIAEQRGAVSGYSALLARTHLREAWRDIRNMKGWSFQLGVGGFSTPGAVNQGSVTVELGSATVIGDAQATLEWLTASTPISFLTNRQFRVGAGTIYNIISYDDGQTVGQGNYPFATLTLDRPFTDLVKETNPNAPFVAKGYTIYQCYYPVPVREFQAWENMCDTTNVIWLNTSPDKEERIRIDRSDPQRQIFSNPTTVLPYEVDQRPGSSTLGWMLYELYPQPQAQYAYQYWYSWAGPDLVNPTDTVPYPITEHCIKALARVKAYEWAAANVDASNPRGAGADFRFLMGAAKAQADEQMKELRLLDRDRVDMWNARMTRNYGYGQVATFNPGTRRVMSRNM